MSDVTDTFYAVASDAIHGYGGQILVGDGASPETFQAVKGVIRITPGSIETADLLTTHLRSPNRHQEHRAGMRDSGEIGIEAIFLPADESQSYAGGGSGSFAQGGMLKFAEDGINRNYIIRLNDVPGGSPGQQLELPVRGYVKGWTPGEITNDDVIKVTGSIMPSQDYVSGLP
jgi:hypothetical protein